MKEPHACICKYRITKVTLFKHATWLSVAMYAGRSGKDFISIHLSGYGGGVHSQVKWII